MLAVAIIGIILIVMIPLPPILLDILLSISIVLSVTTLLLSLYVENALEFSSFPSWLLFLTLLRLGLNIASTRMILTRAEAGDIIRTFGEFVTQSSAIVGMILFSLITIINFIVITKGAGRIAEVAARFTLESLSGKQMAIDSELSLGLLSHSGAKAERDTVRKETDFYGAMDGASKFVRGDAIASLLITAVNIVGGLIIGLAVKKLSWTAAWSTFAKLTIGDGLVTQIPALLVSVGAAIMVTRASQGSLSKLLTAQILHHPKVLMIAAATICLLSLVPGMPIFIMLPMGFSLFFYAVVKNRKREKKKEKKEKKESLFFIHPIEIQLGLNAISLAEPLYEKLTEIRQKIAAHLGICIPQMQINDNLELPLNGWKILIKGVPVDSGRETDCRSLGVTLQEIIENHACEMMNRQDVLQILQEVKTVDSAVVDELIPNKLSVGQLLKILQNLLKEKISIRDMVTILESLADALQGEKNVDVENLTERVRQHLRKGISENFFGKEKIAYAVTFDPKVEQCFDVSNGKLRPKVLDKLLTELDRMVEESAKKNMRLVAITSTSSRLKLRKIIEYKFPNLPVLAYNELTPDVHIQQMGYVANDILI